jgi:two-component system, chemotaxis family, sensor kinase CheA
MQPNALPPELISRFRAVSLERIERIEAAWATAIQEPDKRHVSQEILRDLHTLKGDAKAVGFAEVNRLTHRLEDLVVAAQEHGFHVPDDLDLVVTMGLRFAAVLMRKKAGGALGGIDLDGFIRQVDEVLAEMQRMPRPRARTIDEDVPLPLDPGVTDQLAVETLHKLAAVATSMWLEWRAGGRRSSRLRRAFDELSAQVTRLRAVPLGARLRRHVHGLPELARELGKHVALELELGDVQVAPAVADAIDTAVMHALRNAVDHGVERPELRRLAGKPAMARLSVICQPLGDELLVHIEDDGQGVDRERVRCRGLELGLLDGAAECSDEQLLSLLFMPGFSTRRVVSEVSGRGMGLDAVRTGLSRLGGRISLASTPGHGTTVTIVVPRQWNALDVRRLDGTGGVVLALPACWDVVEQDRAAPTRVLDPLERLGLGTGGPGTLLVVRSGALELGLRLAAQAGMLVRAARVCPTADDHPCEVLRAEGEELLLVRPDGLELGGEVT